MNGYLGIHTDGLNFLKVWQMMAKIIEEYFSKSYLMLYEWVKVKKYLPLGSQKIMNGYLGICSDGFHFLSLWQMMPKIIEQFIFVFMVNGTSMCQTKKIVTCGVSKIYEWILRDTYRWVKLSKGVTDDG